MGCRVGKRDDGCVGCLDERLDDGCCDGSVVSVLTLDSFDGCGVGCVSLVDGPADGTVVGVFLSDGGDVDKDTGAVDGAFDGGEVTGASVGVFEEVSKRGEVTVAWAWV